MKKIVLCAAISVFSVLCAGDKESEKENSSNSNESSESQEASGVDRVIEAIAEAAASNRDYGKDIGDR
jgi:hypothetical protein